MTSSNIYKSLSNIDISYLVISSLSVSDTDKYLEFLEHSIHMRHDDINYLRGVRKSPVSLFSKLVDDPERLLGLMTENKVILSGSRAVSFMYPLFSSKNSDWDFYCPPLTGKSYYPRSDVVF